MNFKIIKYNIGFLLKIEGILMIIPIICGIIYRENATMVFILCSFFTFLIGSFFSMYKPKNQSFYLAESFITVSFGWIFLSIFGAIPFVASGEIPHFIDALFETISGFTTTGATIVDNVEIMSRCVLLWRSFTHFVGGMGVLVLMLAIIPTQSNNMLIMKAESPGPEVGRILPHVKDTAKILYIIYVFLTVLAIISYIISGMPIFDSICIGLGTAGTGGFSVLNDSCASYSHFSQTLISIFMLMFGVNFNIYYLLLIRKYDNALKSEEFRAYIIIVVFSILSITINAFSKLSHIFNLNECFHNALFSVSSVMTTTGYSIFDITMFPTESRFILLMLMFIGGCAGSTAGGIKVARILLATKEAKNEINCQIRPNSLRYIKYDGKKVSENTISTMNAFLIVYMCIFIISVFLISFENYDFETTISSVAETLNNIGVGLGEIGPKNNFNIFHYPSKILFMFLMLVGRLEVYPIVVLFSKKAWKREI